MTGTPITEDWLKANGFKWHQLDRQPHKHWLLWLASGFQEQGKRMFASAEDLGIEVTPTWIINRNGDKVGDDKWFCWLRDDAAGRYHRFIHIRHVSTAEELVALIEAIIGAKFIPEHALYGSLRIPEDAARLLQEHDRLDRRIQRNGAPWSEAEKDATRGRALPEHLETHIRTEEPKP